MKQKQIYHLPSPSYLPAQLYVSRKTTYLVFRFVISTSLQPRSVTSLIPPSTDKTNEVYQLHPLKENIYIAFIFFANYQTVALH